ncbi:MAG: Gfo/Idh/MocA family oxidoreductase, partial [Bacteroidota bacterium]
MLNFAIVGCGHIEIGKAEKIGRKYNVHVYTNFSSLLLKEKNIHVAAVCTPNGLHDLHTVEALRSGLHVICEKPMAITVSDCKLMIGEACKASMHLFVVKQNRFNPPVQAVKHLLDQKKLGRIYSVHLNCIWNRGNEYYKDSWRGTMEMDGGILFTQFSHFIDLLYWMFGDIDEVKAFTSNFAHQNIIEFEDSGVACFRFKNSMLGSIHFSINSYKKNMEGSLTIIAEKGTIKIGGQYLNQLEYQLVENTMIGNLPNANSANDYGAYQGSMSNHDKIYDHVTEVILHNGVNRFNGNDGLKTVEIIGKI